MNNIYNTVMTFHKEISNDENHRYKSWEHCFKYFSLSRDDIEIDKACLHLSFYLASWGMYRGSSYLLWKDYLIHEDVVNLILSSDYKDLQNTIFSENDMRRIEELTKTIRKIYQHKITEVNGEARNVHISDTLVTKIILGTLGCVPAYDRFFLNGMRESELKPLKFNTKSLKMLVDFYNMSQNKKDIDKLAYEINYPVMKILDMYFWQIGYELEAN